MSDNIQHIPLSALRESPFNPRTNYKPAKLQELVDDINGQGILQPLVVRPLPQAQADVEHRYEIVFGHRRKRAAALSTWYDEATGVLGVPCIVREMTDVEAAIAQFGENHHRDDVDALEEADSLARMHRVLGIKADDIGVKIGKSRSFVYGRLKLAAACDDLRKAITDEKLPPETALEIARLRGDKLQRAGLKACRDYSGEWLSQRQAKAAVQRLFDCRLEDAEFDPTQADLLKLVGACTHCPKLAGNDVDLLEAGLAADVCTDSGCYTEKQKQHTRVVLVPRYQAQGLEIIEGARAAELWPNVNRGPSGYRRAADDAQVIHQYTGRMPKDAGYMGEVNGYLERTLPQLLAELAEWGQPVPTVQRVVIVSPHTGLASVWAPDVAVDEVCEAWGKARRERMAAAAGGASTPSTAARGEHGPREDRMADWTPAERLTTDGAAWRRVRLATLGALMTRPRTADELRMLLLNELRIEGDLRADITALMGLDAEYDAADEADDDLDADDWWQAKLAAMTADQLGMLVAGLAVGGAMEWTYGPTRAAAAAKVAIAERYGVDVLAAARPEQTDEAGDAGDHDTKASAPAGDLFGAAA